MTEQLTDRYCVMVNGHAVEPGCWVDGHWGQYGPDHLADRAEELGWEAKHVADDPRRLRKVADWFDSKLPAQIPYCRVCNVHVEWVDTPTDENPRLRTARHAGTYIEHAAFHAPDPTWGSGVDCWELRIDADDRIVAWLNEHLETEGYWWGWHDGEFYLWPTETWEENSD